MSQHRSSRLVALLSLVVVLGRAAGAHAAAGGGVEACMACHEDQTLKSQAGQRVGVRLAVLKASAHARQPCTACHDQPGNYDDVPHFPKARAVRCAKCHARAAESFDKSFHGQARVRGRLVAPTCLGCHSAGESHRIQPLRQATAEAACRRCHAQEAQRYDKSVHRDTAARGGPGCVTCHATHSAALPPSAGMIARQCEGCHKGAMKQVELGVHRNARGATEQVTACASCHDVHATHKPHLDPKLAGACERCHPKHRGKLVGSVHESLFKDGSLTCLSCHRTHQVTDAKEAESFGCGSCHSDEEQEYRESAHRLARLRHVEAAATCADCHDGHHVLAAQHPRSPVHRKNIAATCARCHTDKPKITADYVRLPISLPRYQASVHGAGQRRGKSTAVCTDCHGAHALHPASSPKSSIFKGRLASTCGRCHAQEAREYADSVHGRAVAHGIVDSPSCTDCHEEHLILPHDDPRSPVHRARLAHEVCARCHEDVEMAARYGLPQKVVESYADSYHGWAVKRGGKFVAVCVDCHNTHAIGSALDPSSSIHPRNVVATCGRCHERSNAKFAASYSHVRAAGQRMVHDWVRLGYIVFLALVLGGMLLHNLVLFSHDLRRHYRAHRSGRAVRRMSRSEVWQHLVLLATFFVLAITGFALRFPDSWWAHLLSHLGFTEETRRLVHRLTAAVLVGASAYHLGYLLLSRRGRHLGRELLPRVQDLKDAVANVAYHLGRRAERPTFGTFDYTQKAEYWALIWGTALMCITGLVLWFPDIVTGWLPAWVVRVCEVIHFYEAILAVSAIIIWHLFFVVFATRQYPMSWVWIDGRMPLHEWEEHHGRVPHEPPDDGVPAKPRGTPRSDAQR